MSSNFNTYRWTDPLNLRNLYIQQHKVYGLYRNYYTGIRTDQKAFSVISNKRSIIFDTFDDIRLGTHLSAAPIVRQSLRILVNNI